MKGWAESGRGERRSKGARERSREPVESGVGRKRIGARVLRDQGKRVRREWGELDGEFILGISIYYY